MKKPKQWFVIEKHAEALRGTVFGRKCAHCHGCIPKLEIINGEKQMPCSCAGATAVFVTAQQAAACIDEKPFGNVKKQEVQHVSPHPMFKKQVRQLAAQQ
jgi:hypothetical protein